MNSDGKARSYHVVVAFEGDSRYAELGHYGTVRSTWKFDPQWVKHFLHNDELFIEKPLTRTAVNTKRTTLKNNGKVGSFVCEAINRATGWWPKDATLPESLEHYSLQHLLRQDGVLVEPDLREGQECLRIHTNDQECWVDPLRSFAVIERRVRLNESNWFVYRNYNLEELSPGFWMPRRFETSLEQREIEYSRVFSRDVRFVVSYQVNCDLDDQFAFKWTPGMFVRFIDSNKQQFEKGGEDLLDELSEYASAQLARTKDDSRTPSLRKLIAMCVLFFSSLAVGLFLANAIWQRFFRESRGA